MNWVACVSIRWFRKSVSQALNSQTMTTLPTPWQICETLKLFSPHTVVRFFLFQITYQKKWYFVNFFMVYCLQIATRLFFEIAKNNISDSSKLELYHGNRMQPVNFHSAPTCKPLYLSVGVSVCLQKWQQRASNTSQVWHSQLIIKWWEIRKYVIQVYFNSILLILLYT